MSINQTIQDIYRGSWEGLQEGLVSLDACKYTNPFLISFDEDMLNKSDLKVMIFGQVTKGWGDRFENFILKSRAQFSNGETVDLSFSNFIFGQCWSLDKESDAMWRIYSHEKNGVKVRTSSKKLLSALSSNVDNPNVSAFIGKVQYETQKELTNMVSDRVRMNNKVFDTSGKGQAETLLFKRKEFFHEKEIRIIYSGTESDSRKDIFPFQIDPFDLIEEIIFDPRMDKDLSKIYINHFKGIGFKGGLKRSTLYELPNLKISV